MTQSPPYMVSDDLNVADRVRWVRGRYWHHSDTTGNAMQCNTQQGGEEKTAWKCCVCSRLQTPAMP